MHQFQEGKQSKGGHNPPNTSTERPPAPGGSGGSSAASKFEAMQPVKLQFNPHTSRTVEKLWSTTAGQLLFLLWRPFHIVGPGWFHSSECVAQRIDNRRPQTAEQLYECFLPVISYVDSHTKDDCREFCRDAIDYFTGRKSVEYCWDSHSQLGMVFTTVQMEARR